MDIDTNAHYAADATRQNMHFNAEYAKNAEKRREEILCESLFFSAPSAFKHLSRLSKTIQTIENRVRPQS